MNANTQLSAAEIPPYLAGKTRVTSWIEANEVLRHPDFVAGNTEQESVPFRGRTLLELNGDEHRDRRRLEMPLFVREALESYESDVLAPTIERCLAEAESRRGSDGVVRGDLVRMSHSMFLQIAAAVIGFDDVHDPDRTRLLEECMYPLNDAIDVKYSTRDHAEVVAEGLVAKTRLIEQFYRPAVERRLRLIRQRSAGDEKEVALPRDLLTIMLVHHPQDWDEDLPVRETLLFLAGSTSTTSNAVNHSVVELERWLNDHPEDHRHLDDNAFLRGVCNEALRLRQNVTALVRRAATDVTLSTGRLIPAGEFAAVDLMAASRDPTAFGPDSAVFNPWRRVKPPVRPYGLAFGTARHQCIGLPVVTSVTGKPPEGGEGERAMLKILRALLKAGVQLDPEQPPTYLPTTEPVFATLPVVLTALGSP